MIELKSVMRYGDFDERTYVNTTGYFSDYDVVEREIDLLLCKQTPYVMFVTVEHSIDMVDDLDEYKHRVVRYRQYKMVDGKAVMVHETETDFKGHVPDGHSYEVGDIIDYVCEYDGDGYTGVGIVCDTPVSVEHAEELRVANELVGRRLKFTELDDSYLVARLGDVDVLHAVRTVDVIGRAEVTDYEKKHLKELLKEFEEKQWAHIKREN